MRFLTLLAVLAALAPAPSRAAAPGARILAAENMYADIARQIARPGAVVTAVMSNPDTDPHLFEASPSVAREIARADIVVENGAGYDPWMDALLGAGARRARVVLTVAAMVHAPPGANPHLWYDPATMPVFARALTAALIARDPADRDGLRRREARVLASLAALRARVAGLRARLRGIPVAATEPVFGYMAAALGLRMREAGFQLAVMNDTEPAPRQVAAFERDLRTHAVRLLIYNRQATNGAARRLRAIARAVGIPVLGVTETEPAHTTYQAWIGGELDRLAALLDRSGR